MLVTNELNPEQLEAVQHVEGPLLVLAGAGSGKTRVVTHRIAHLLQLGVPAQEIVAVTFTNKAAQEMKERVYSLTQQRVLACTFHSLCAKILRESIGLLGFQRDFTIYDEEDSRQVLKECLLHLGQKVDKAELKRLRSEISNAKNALLFPEAFSSQDLEFFKVYQKYQEMMKSYQALDFDDLLFLSVALFKQFPDELARYQKRWSFILIDEYQDTNEAQYMLIEMLSLSHRNVFAVGDPDQSIYSWRGANIQNILNFKSHFPGAKVITLEQNYRSRATILEASNALISCNSGRFEKNLWSQRGEGEKIVMYKAPSDRKEVEFVLNQLLKLHQEKGIPFSDCAILYRTHFQSRLFEDYLLKERIPYVIVGGVSFYQRREIKDVLAWLKMVLTGHDGIAFSRTLNLPKRGVGAATLEKLQAAAMQENMSLFDFCVAATRGEVAFKVPARALTGLKEYVEIVHSLRKLFNEQAPIGDFIIELLEKTRYLLFLREDMETYEDRRGNVLELASKAAQFQEESPSYSLALFLEELALKGSHDEAAGNYSAPLKLMTVHNGKGLEFTAVFLVGMEEDLFPHVNAMDDSGALEEERRLCYVGMTRAKDYLFLSSSMSRYVFGYAKTMRPSRFLEEIPSSCVQMYGRGRSIDMEEEALEFEMGDPVRHRDFGLGVIRKIYETSLGLTYEVFFQKGEVTRSLVAKFAKLEKPSFDSFD